MKWCTLCGMSTECFVTCFVIKINGKTFNYKRGRIFCYENDCCNLATRHNGKNKYLRYQRY